LIAEEDGAVEDEDEDADGDDELAVDEPLRLHAPQNTNSKQTNSAL